MDEMAVAWLFWSALSLLVYTYFGYPCLLALQRHQAHRWGDAADLPTVTLIVAAFNEELCIEQKVRNALEHDYPPERLEVLVVSDGSTDRTEAIVRSLEGNRVRLITQVQRRGKNAALNRGVAEAGGEIVVFTDANALLAPGAIRYLVAPFCDPTIGLVSGQGYYGEMGNGTTRVVSNAYVQYEAFIKRREAALGFIAAADGALYAMRRSLYHELPVTQVHDLFHPIQMVLAGYRSVFVPDAYTVEPPSPDASSEYRRHIRIIAQGLLVFLRQAPVLMARGHVIACWMLISHRFLRWISLAFLVLALVTNAMLAGQAPLYTFLFMAQLSFYALALGGAFGEHWQLRFRVLAVPYYFCVVSLVGVGGFLSLLRGNRQATWAPTGEMQ